MITTHSDAATWMRTTVIIFDGGQETRLKLQEEFAEFGMNLRVVYDEDEVLEFERSDSEPSFFLFPIQGLGNRLSAIQELRSVCPKVKLVIISKDSTSPFIELCLSLGASAVIGRYEPLDSIARLSIVAATGH